VRRIFEPKGEEVIVGEGTFHQELHSPNTLERLNQEKLVGGTLPHVKKVNNL
jgi:hypothetical protein